MSSADPSWFDHADCASCEFGGGGDAFRSKEERQAIAAMCEVGDKYQHGGMMVIGEGPGVQETLANRPFVGRSGQLLDALLQSAGIDRDTLWLTNATMCMPPPIAPSAGGKGKGLHERHPTAITSCMPRLETEIAQARPRVIVTLGQASLVSLCGYYTDKQRQIAFECDNANAPEAPCDPKTRKIGPGMECALGTCDWFELLPSPLDYKSDEAKAWRHSLLERTADSCPQCGSSIKKLQVKKSLKCRVCGGRKTRIETYEEFGHPGYKLTRRDGVAGAIIAANTLASQLDEFGVEYVVPTYHPAFCLWSLKDKSGGANKQIGGQYAARVLAVHLEKAHGLLRRDAYFPTNYHIERDPDAIRQWLSEPGTYSVDIETDRKGNAWSFEAITCIGFARADRDTALVVPTFDIAPWWQVQAGTLASKVLDTLQWFLGRTDVTKVFHKGTFDMIGMRRMWGIWTELPYRDTLLEHNNLYPDEEHNLGFCAHELTDLGVWKDTRKLRSDEGHQFSGYDSVEALAQYNAIDCHATARLDELMVGPDGNTGLVALEGRPKALKTDHEMLEIAVEMAWNGLPVSTDVLGTMEADAQANVDTELAAMCAIVGRGPDAFTPRGKDLQWALYDPMGPLGLPIPHYTPSGQPATDKDTLLKLNDVPFVAHLLKWRKHTYAISHYIRSAALRPGPDGRIHPEWKPWGARTGRWSSEPNFQNWPKYMRQGIVAPPGRKIVGADEGQLEIRVSALISGDEALIERCARADERRKLEPDYDPHSYVASLVFSTAFTDLLLSDPAHTQTLPGQPSCPCQTCRRKLLREIVKRVIYGLQYGAGALTVLEAIYNGGYDGPPIAVTLIEKITAILFREFPKIPIWREAILRQAQEERAIYSPFHGRHRIFPLGQVEAPVAYNFPIQSGSADIMNDCLAVVYDNLHDADPTALIIAQVHDAIYVECAEERATRVAALLEEAMTVELSLPGGGPSMPFVASAHIADNWKEAA